jgi:uncharacterized low-complexity protein
VNPKTNQVLINNFAVLTGEWNMSKYDANFRTVASGAIIALGLAGTAHAAADANPFGLTALDNGYRVAQAATEGKCGAGKMAGEGNCGADKMKAAGEGNCGADKMKAAGEGNCGADKTKAAGEGNCGGNKAAGEGNCGADKAKAAGEGKCGEAKCGGKK